MKLSFEKVLISLVAVVFALVIYLVVSYNMIQQDVRIADVIPEETLRQPSQSDTTKSYLDALESYGEDKDVKVDPTEERHVNTVKVNAEIEETDIDKVVETNAKEAYEKALEAYDESSNRVVAQNKEEEALEDISEQPQQNGDTIAGDLDAIIGE